MKQLIFALCVFFAISVAAVNASGQSLVSPGDYTIVKSGQTVPFDGWLFTQSAIGKMVAKYQGQQQICEKDLQYQKDVCILQMGKMDEQCAIRLKAERQRYDNVVKIKNEEIAKLRGQHTYKYKFWDKPLWYGVAAGVVLGVLSSYGGYKFYKQVIE